MEICRQMRQIIKARGVARAALCIDRKMSVIRQGSCSQMCLRRLMDTGCRREDKKYNQGRCIITIN